MKHSDILVRIIYGWFTRSEHSEGLMILARRLREKGYDVVDDIRYNYADNIAALFDADNHRARAVIGFSMGANCVSWISNRIKRPIDLGVAYDPSWGIPIFSPAHIEPVSSKIKRCLVYQGTGIPVGGARLEGPTVETIKAGLWHFSMDHSEELHQRTLAALARLEN